VETIDQGTMLLRMGCEQAQGYVIARPMPAEKMQAWIDAWKPDPQWVQATAINADDRMLLYAYVEQRARIASIEAFFKGERNRLPQIKESECRFGRWITNARTTSCCDKPAFQALDQLHCQIHTISAEILNLKTMGRISDGFLLVGELNRLRDALFELIKGY
jgi:hypothetical protein